MLSGSVDPNHDRVRDLSAAGRPSITTNIAHDHGSVADLQLRSVVLADL
jgi:hypothetical protein